MHQRFWASLSKVFVPALALSVLVAGTTSAQFQEADAPQKKKTTEPVFRISKLSDSVRSSKSISSFEETLEPTANDENDSVDIVKAPVADRIADSSNLPGATRNVPKITPVTLPPVAAKPAEAKPAEAKRAPHPLDRAVDFAEQSLSGMRADVRDYTAIMAKREQVNGVIGEPSYMNVKIRCPRENADGSSSPFSIYMKFLRPKDSAGREVIWVEGKNDGKLVVHEGKGIIRLKTFRLDPTGVLAMRGQKYPIYEAGLEKLIMKLIEKAERDRAAGPCKVEYRSGANINNRPCSLIELVHEERMAPYEFHKAQVFIDDELNVPVRFAAYDWPTSPGATPALLEEYTYYNVKTNVGLTDNDFNPKNTSYRFK